MSFRRVIVIALACIAVVVAAGMGPPIDRPTVFTAEPMTFGEVLYGVVTPAEVPVIAALNWTVPRAQESPHIEMCAAVEPVRRAGEERGRESTEKRWRAWNRL